MAVVFALPRLFDRVVARFAAELIDVPQAFGWLATSEQYGETSRITWTPGDEGGALGAVMPPRYTGGNPRQLATLLELCTVEIAAFDPVRSADERAQYQVTRELFDVWLRAVLLEARGTVQVLSTKWVGGDRARRSGAVLRVVFTLQAPIFDEALESAATDTGAAIGVAELDIDELIDIPPPA